MSFDPWLEIPNNQKGLYQLVGTPTSNYSLLLYGKSLLATHEGSTIFYIDNNGSIDKTKLKIDLQKDESLLSNYYVFSPKNQFEFFETIDDLELLYIRNSTSPIIFISSIFQFLLKNPRHNKNNELIMLILGLLKSYNLPIFVTNESRKISNQVVPFLSYLLPKFFDKVILQEHINGENTYTEINNQK